jgi:hypothetical protein
MREGAPKSFWESCVCVFVILFFSGSSLPFAMHAEAQTPPRSMPKSSDELWLRWENFIRTANGEGLTKGTFEDIIGIELADSKPGKHNSVQYSVSIRLPSGERFFSALFESYPEENTYRRAVMQWTSNFFNNESGMQCPNRYKFAPEILALGWTFRSPPREPTSSKAAFFRRGHAEIAYEDRGAGLLPHRYCGIEIAPHQYDPIWLERFQHD